MCLFVLPSSSSVSFDRKMHSDLFFMQLTAFCVDQSGVRVGFRGAQSGNDVCISGDRRLRLIVDYFEAPRCSQRINLPLTLPRGNLRVPSAMTKIKWAGLPLPSCLLHHSSLRTCQPQSEVQLHHPCGPALTTAPSPSLHPCSFAGPKVGGSTNPSTRRLYRLTVNGSKQGEFCFHRHLLCPLGQGDPLWGSQPWWQFQFNAEKQLIDFFKDRGQDSSLWES